MGLLGMAIAGGIAQGAGSLSDSIEQQEKMQYAEMLQAARQRHEEYLVGLRHKLDTESRDSGMVDANGRPLMRSEYDALEDKAGTQNAHAYQQGIKDQGEIVGINLDNGEQVTTEDIQRDGLKNIKYTGAMELEKHDADIKDKKAAAEEKTKRGEYYEKGGGSRGSGQLAMKIQAIKDQGYPPEQEAELIQDAIHKETQFKPPVEKKPTYNKAAADEVVSLKGEIEAAHRAGDTDKAKELQDSLNSTLGEYGKPLQRFVPEKKESTPGMISKATGGFINTANDKVTPGYWVTEKPEDGGNKGMINSRPAADENLGEAMIKKESSGNQNAVSPTGVKGLTQLTKATGKGEGVDRDKPFENVAGGLSYLGKLVDKYGDKRIALIAYNMGPGATDEWLKSGADPAKLPPKTRAYADSVLRLTNKYVRN
jgi:hypothetical protein